MLVRHNIGGMNANRNRGITNDNLNRSLEKLSTGYRINRAGDDAAGLAISETMRSQINGLDQAMHNVNDGIGMSQTGDGALAEVHAMLHRLETLAVQAANGTYSTLARENIEAERAQLLDEIDRIGQATDFNSISMFDSEDPPVPIMPPQIKDDITLQIGHSVDETLDMRRYYVSSKALLLDRTDFTTVDKANASTDIIRDAVQAISQIRSSFGSVQSHLEHTHNNLSVTEENMTAAESKIRDTDMADEFTTYTKENIMFQAGASMSAQANAVPQRILDLLQN
ncbi:MAG: flagellin [Clostridium sp.]|nr:flagellin [Clostridium sp.]